MSNDKLPTADAERLSNEIIAIMTDHGLTPDEMLQVIRLAREKYKHMKNGRCISPVIVKKDAQP